MTSSLETVLRLPTTVCWSDTAEMITKDNLFALAKKGWNRTRFPFGYLPVGYNRLIDRFDDLFGVLGSNVR